MTGVPICRGRQARTPLHQRPAVCLWRHIGCTVFAMFLAPHWVPCLSRWAPRWKCPCLCACPGPLYADIAAEPVPRPPQRAQAVTVDRRSQVSATHAWVALVVCRWRRPGTPGTALGMGCVDDRCAIRRACSRCGLCAELDVVVEASGLAIAEHTRFCGRGRVWRSFAAGESAEGCVVVDASPSNRRPGTLRRLLGPGYSDPGGPPVWVRAESGVRVKCHAYAPSPK